MKMTRSLGTVCLAAWLILTGALPFLHVSFPYRGPLLAVLAIAAGVLLLVGR
jgi:hypothetical protein